MQLFECLLACWSTSDKISLASLVVNFLYLIATAGIFFLAFKSYSQAYKPFVTSSKLKLSTDKKYLDFECKNYGQYVAREFRLTVHYAFDEVFTQATETKLAYGPLTIPPNEVISFREETNGAFNEDKSVFIKITLSYKGLGETVQKREDVYKKDATTDSPFYRVR